MKKTIAAISIFLLTLSLTLLAFAGGSFSGTVTKVDGDKVTLKVDKIPSWVKKGGNVQAVGGTPNVVKVEGSEVVLRLSKTKAATIKVDSVMTVTEASADSLQGC